MYRLIRFLIFQRMMLISMKIMEFVIMLHILPYVPEIRQLWFRGVTDKNGDYLITGIPYLTDGSSFNIVPLLAPHEFNPGNKTLFLSDQSQVHNNIDFIDISSFKVNGSVVYRNTTFRG